VRRSRALLVAAATAAMLLLIAAVVFGLGDRSMLVPAPEAVSEGLMRQLATHRYGQTRQYVGDEARVTLSPRSLRAWFEPLEARIGSVRHVEGRQARIDGETAGATVHLAGEIATATCEVTLVRRHGVWFVTGVTAR